MIISVQNVGISLGKMFDEICCKKLFRFLLNDQKKAWQRKVARPPAKSVEVQYSSGRLQPNSLKLLGTATRISTPHPNVNTFGFVKQEILVHAVPRNFLTAIRLRRVVFPNLISSNFLV